MKKQRDKINRLYQIINKQNSLMEGLRESKDKAYIERNKLVCALSKIYPSWLGKDEELEKKWQNVVYIALPTGQVSWHITEDVLSLFSHLEFEDLKWDGHTTEEKYERLLNLNL